MSEPLRFKSPETMSMKVVNRGNCISQKNKKQNKNKEWTRKKKVEKKNTYMQSHLEQ